MRTTDQAPAEAQGGRAGGIGEPCQRFVIDDAEKRRRWINAGWGLVFSVGLVTVVAYEHQQDPAQAARGVLWTVTLLLTLANLTNLVLLLRYLGKVGKHYLELDGRKLRFVTRGEVTELDLEQVVAMREFTRFGKLRHIQLLLRNHRGIRLEGYGELSLLAKCLQKELSPSKLMH